MSKDIELSVEFKISIIEEMLKEINPTISKEEIQEIWLMCECNPWDAVLYRLLKLKEKQNERED